MFLSLIGLISRVRHARPDRLVWNWMLLSPRVSLKTVRANIVPNISKVSGNQRKQKKWVTTMVMKSSKLAWIVDRVDSFGWRPCTLGTRDSRLVPFRDSEDGNLSQRPPRAKMRRNQRKQKNWVSSITTKSSKLAWIVDRVHSFGWRPCTLGHRADQKVCQ